MAHPAADSVEHGVVRRLAQLNLGSAVSFVLGGALFALGAAFAELEVGSLRTVNVTYLVGGFFFSLGGYALILLVANTASDTQGPSEGWRMRWWTTRPPQPGWLSAVVLFAGTLLFAVSLVAAFAEGLTPRQSDTWIWVPDILGCVCFLVSGHLALRDLRKGHLRIRIHQLGWWIAGINQIGSVLFFLAGIAAFVRPATSSVVNAGLVNWGTFAGAICFAIGGLLQVFDRPRTSTAGGSG